MSTTRRTSTPGQGGQTISCRRSVSRRRTPGRAPGGNPEAGRRRRSARRSCPDRSPQSSPGPADHRRTPYSPRWHGKPGFLRRLQACRSHEGRGQGQRIEHFRQWLSEENLGLIKTADDGKIMRVPPDRSTCLFITELEPSPPNSISARVDELDRKLDRILGEIRRSSEPPQMSEPRIPGTAPAPTRWYGCSSSARRGSTVVDWPPCHFQVRSRSS